MAVDREYFESDNQTIGYRSEGFRDFPTHFAAVSKILSLSPANVFEIGGARGYVTKKLIANGIPAITMDCSEHCFHTRATNEFLLWDIENIPYPFGDKQFDLVFSDSVLEHLHYESIDKVVKEITRVSRRSLHGVPITDSGQTREQFMSDNTHVIFESKSWWIEKFAAEDADHVVTISGNIMGEFKDGIMVGREIPGVSIDGSDLVKLNVGSYINMFYYGWTNTDILDLSMFAKSNKYIFNQHDATKPFPVKDNYVNLIFTSHVLEHLSLAEGLNFLKECHRMMCEGGHIRIAVPDTRMLMKKCVDHELDFLKHISPGAEKAPCNIDKFYEVALANHKRMYDVCNLTYILESVGFKDVSTTDPFHSRSDIMEKETIVSHPSISLVMEGTK